MKKARAGASHRGKSGSKFQFDVTVHDVSGLKAGNTYLVKWTRGAKVASTKPLTAEGPSASRGTGWASDKLSLLVTLFRPPDGANFDVKDAKLALVSVNPAKRGSEKTVAKVHFNLADYAGVPSATATTRLALSERVGIKLTVACKFMKVSSGPGADASYAPSGMSGLSGVTGLGGGSSSSEGEDDGFADLAVDDVPEPAPLRNAGEGSREGGASLASLSTQASPGSQDQPRRQASTAAAGASSAAATGKEADQLREKLGTVVAERTRLDAIVTVADAVHLDNQLGEHHEAEEQIAFADIVLLNKTDLVNADGLGRVEERIRRINPYAKIIRTERCGADLDEVIGLEAFSLERVLAVGDVLMTHEGSDAALARASMTYSIPPQRAT